MDNPIAVLALIVSIVAVGTPMIFPGSEVVGKCLYVFAFIIGVLYLIYSKVRPRRIRLMDFLSGGVWWEVQWEYPRDKVNEDITTPHALCTDCGVMLFELGHKRLRCADPNCKKEYHLADSFEYTQRIAKYEAVTINKKKNYPRWNGKKPFETLAERMTPKR